MPEKIIQQGAEAKIILKDNRVIKRRIKKSYRILEIDEKIRKLRTRSEGKMLERASKVILIPNVMKVDEKNKEILMQYINGKKLSDNLDNFNEKKQEEICEKIGENTAKIHDENLIHGDLTTSNMIYVEKTARNNKLKSSKSKKEVITDNKVDSIIVNNKLMSKANSKLGVVAGNITDLDKDNFEVYFIDFGLGFHSLKIEDKAVDLHLLKEALEAKHFKNWEKLFKAVCKGYSISKDNKKVLEQLKKVESRGRYKEKY